MGKQEKKKITPNEAAIIAGMEIIKANHLFDSLYGGVYLRKKDRMGKASAIADSSMQIFLNQDMSYTPEEWAYMIAHCKLHYAFGHFDEDHLPAVEYTDSEGVVNRKVDFDKYLWNMACDIYITRFLDEMRFGRNPGMPADGVSYLGREELDIYRNLLEQGIPKGVYFGTGVEGYPDMQGLEKPLVYEKNSRKDKRATEWFAEVLSFSVSDAVMVAGGYTADMVKTKGRAGKMAEWFMNHYPLLGGLASGIKIIEDASVCRREEISVAAVDVVRGEIYVNPAAKLNDAELRFVMAHEFLHAGLMHHERCSGRDAYLWNVACDYVINGWLHEMRVGSMPAVGCLYDPDLSGQSAEEIYDRLVTDLRRARKLQTLRGYGMGDVIYDGYGGRNKGGISLDDFYRNALQQGLEYHIENRRGLVPAGLVEEIRALAMPPIPWDVELGRWFDVHFQPIEAKRTYARPSRRQGSTPEIPRPRYVNTEVPEYSRTFGVVIDTSGSMSAKLIGYALGAIASYSEAKEVPYARVVFCDADAYDAGYISPENIAGRVEVKGRGGTELQPAVDMLEGLKDFPKDAPILLITDGYIDDHMTIHREHAFLLPKGHRLPFRPVGDVFYFEESE